VGKRFSSLSPSLPDPFIVVMVAATQTTNTDRIQHASALKDAKNTEQAILAYQSVLNEPTTNDQVLREQEVALIHLGEIYRELQ
jgi:26S proteasome regulatory subunit N6